MRSFVALLALMGAGFLGWVLYYVAGPTVDNWLQIKTSRDLEILRRYPVGTMSLGRLLATRYRVQSWEAYHEDWIFATRIDCTARDPSGKFFIFSWEVRHGNPPRDWMPDRDLYITPLSPEAAQLVPSLLPPGVLPDDLPLSNFGSGVVYDIAHYKHR